MAFREKFEILIDVTTEGARKSLKQLKTDVGEADGIFGKLKVGAGGAMDYLKQNAGAFALAAGTAIVGFGVKAVGAFEDTAKAAIDLGTATGLSTEQASRWIAVGDDMGVSAEQLAAGIGQITKGLDASKWEKYGIETRDAAGKARDANDILLDSFDVLAKETNATERARLGKELLGKSYGALSPLIGKTRAEMEQYLGSVEKGQVITGKEAEKAERMRLAQDALSDAFQEITLAVGGYVAELAPAIELTAKIVGGFAELLSGTDDSAAGWEKVTAAVIRYGTPVGWTIMAQEKLLTLINGETLATDKLYESIRPLIQATAKQAETQTAANAASSAGVGHLADLERAADQTERAVSNLDDAVGSLKGKLSENAAWRDAQQAMWDLAVAINDPESNMGDLADKSDRAALALLGVIEKTDKIPRDIKTELVTLLDQGKLEEVQRIISKYELGVTVPVKFQATGGALPQVPRFDNGGVMPGPKGVHSLALVAGGETILPTHKGGGGVGGGGGSIIINTGADPRSVIAVIKEYKRKGGVL